MHGDIYFWLCGGNLSIEHILFELCDRAILSSGCNGVLDLRRGFLSKQQWGLKLLELPCWHLRIGSRVKQLHLLSAVHDIRSWFSLVRIVKRHVHSGNISSEWRLYELCYRDVLHCRRSVLCKLCSGNVHSERWLIKLHELWGGDIFERGGCSLH